MLKNSIEIPWRIYYYVAAVREILQNLVFFVTHTYREGNQMADGLANFAMDNQVNGIFLHPDELSTSAKGIYFMDETKLPHIRVL